MAEKIDRLKEANAREHYAGQLVIPRDAEDIGDGALVVRNAIPRELTKKLVRRLWHEFKWYSPSGADLQEWAHATAFPALRREPEVMNIRSHIENEYLLKPVEWEPWPQIIMRLPDEDDVLQWNEVYHRDNPNEGVPAYEVDESRVFFNGIIGVALTRSDRSNGCVLFKDSHGNGPIPAEMEAGDMLYMAPAAEHSAPPNPSDEVRFATYFRW